MEVFKDIPGMVEYIDDCRKNNDTIGFVPTMGALHEGHLSLVRKAREENAQVVVSIFVNPAQFGPGEDFEKYPRDLKSDLGMLLDEGVDAVFTPNAEDIYPKEFFTLVDVGRLPNYLCGISRPSHFRGVTTVVTKLFNIVRPDRAYFGQKDAQQAIIIKKMVRDLNVQTEICVLPTVREEDGLAMSSRNKYLSKSERARALCLSHALIKAGEMIADGNRDAMEIIEQMANIIEEQKAEIDYVAIVDADTLEDIGQVRGNVLIAVAVIIGHTRLIDNIMLYDIK